MQTFDLEIGLSQNFNTPKIYYSVTIWPQRSLLGQLSLIYSLLPILLYPWILVLWAVYDNSLIPVAALLFGLLATALNELTLKPWLKEPRPVQCPIKNSYGMPSGHSLFAGLLLALLWKYKSTLLTRFALLLALAPVPWARWHNKDHTDRQVVVGSVLGLSLGVLLALFT